jgi:predicted O-methyltransferase YrrM
MNTQPLVSCIMPTYNRRPFIPHAIDYFLREHYPNRELIIVDDGPDAIHDLIPEDARILYLRLDNKLTLGAKLNMACERAKGEIIAHWDDDDWYAPWRLSYQVETLVQEKTEICGINKLLYFDLRTGQAFQYIYPPEQRVWLLGSDLCYSKAFWSNHRFANINVGMDGYFVWSAPPQSISVLKDPTFAVHMIHDHNVSPKRTNGSYWHRHPAEEIEKVMGIDWPYYQHEIATGNSCPRARLAAGEIEQKVVNASYATIPIRQATPIRNVYACLVHENLECVIDLVRNLRCLDGTSRVLLYDGSNAGNLLDKRLPWSRWGVDICPQPRSMKWGHLHGFALDCLRYLKSSEPFDVMTVVDSDQLALRLGYADFLARYLGNRAGLGLLSSAPERQGPNTRIPPAVTAQQELDLWRPFLRRFPGGEDKFVHWTFWPSTVITADAGFALLDLFDQDAELARILGTSRLWATEEVLFPTLTALLGFRVERNPCAFDYVQYRKPFGIRDVEAALRRSDVYWMHPVPRRYDDPLRIRIRQAHGDYLAPQSADTRGGRPHADQLWPMLRTMRSIEGWLEDEEAELLAIAAREVVIGKNGIKTIVEIGSHCGKATFVLASVVKMFASEARVVAVDTFDGMVGALDRGLIQRGPTLQKFTRMLEETELAAWVETRVGRAHGLSWDKPVDLLLVDGLHDYASVAQDFYTFEAWLKPGALAAFHDYADYFPGVCAFVDELLASKEWQEIAQAGTMKLLRRLAHLEASKVVAIRESTFSEKTSQTMDEEAPRVSLA